MTTSRKHSANDSFEITSKPEKSEQDRHNSNASQPEITCSKLTIETLERVKYVQS